eukprot:scaffold4342_cov27-Tisochrysis_lutea.AAC.4
MASGSPSSLRIAKASFSYAAIYLPAAEVHVPTDGWQEVSMPSMHWIGPAGLQTTAWTTAPSRKRRVSDLSPHNSNHAVAAAPPGTGPRSTRPEMRAGSKCTPTCMRLVRSARAPPSLREPIRRSGSSASASCQQRTRRARRARPAPSTASAATVIEDTTPSDVGASLASSLEGEMLASPDSAATALSLDALEAAAAAFVAWAALAARWAAATPSALGISKEKIASYRSDGCCGQVKSSAKDMASSSTTESIATMERRAQARSSRKAPRVTPEPKLTESSLSVITHTK